MWFQQDGATPHTAHHVLKWLKETFATRIVSLKTDIPWPPHSPDLSPLDFFLWGHLKDRVYKGRPTSRDELKRAIENEISEIPIDMCKSTIANFMKRVETLRRQNGRHFEYLL